jgi:hypothetical protein
MLFLAGVVLFFFVGFLLTKEKVVHTTLCTTYVERKTTKNTLNITFFRENVLVPLYGCMLSFVEIRHWLYFQNNVAMFGFCIEVEGIDNIYAPVIIRHLSIGITTVTVIKIII